MEEEVRIDKWLWAVRIYKTRSMATSEIQKGRVTINGIAPKPSRIVKPGEIITVRKPPVTYTYRVKGLLHNRVSAKIAKEYVDDLTPPEEIQKFYQQRLQTNLRREKGSGRPTKKERRQIEKLIR